MRQIPKEQQTITFMIQHYCHAVHKQKQICVSCQELIKFGNHKLEICRYGDQKPSCNKCTTHCYPPEKRKQMIAVMRYVGPRMAILRPLQYLRHLWPWKK